MSVNRYAFAPNDLDAVYRAIFGRRDTRSYRPEPLPQALVWKILGAAHAAPSVGFMQPWNFILIQDLDRRAALLEHFTQVSKRAAKDFKDDRNLRYRALKLQGILDAPLNLLVTCDRGRDGPNVLGRSVQRDTDIYSTCLAIQNLWLAAHAEGVGVGWMSIAEPNELQRAFGLPEQVVPVAYLTLGWPVELPDTPLLERVGWKKRTPLRELIFSEQWGVPAPAPSARQQPEPLPPEQAQALAAERRSHLTRPAGSLGRLETVVARMVGIQGGRRARIERRALLLLAGDHGVTVEGVSAYRREVTAKMVYQFVAGGAAVCAISRQAGLPIVVADLGVDHDFGVATGIQKRKVVSGTQNIAQAPAMTVAQCAQAVQTGRELVQEMGPMDLLAIGEMGIGNSTIASAMVAALLDMPAADVVGIGTGVGPRTRHHKALVIERALARHGAERDPMGVLASLGGSELAGLVGAIQACAAARIPVVLDGFITGAAALCAARIDPSVCKVLIAGHRSPEPGHRFVLEALGLEPLLELDLRLGEGSGAALATQLLITAARIDLEMCTFEEAGIEHPENPEARQ
ncbi:MAG: nicotinate-nucleotide--dimethylbenzimidazole phosphoribosyltransferase [Cognaticolwellia sp.]|jgi:nicotinate-nucleotide--dimethylbenzimidazole phosphoribosyltransferase